MQARRTALALAAAALVLAAEGARAEEAPAPETAPAQPAGGFSGKTEIVPGPALQVVFGDRAVFHLDDKGEPALDSVEKGELAMAHPAGEVKESFEAPGPGKLAIALDGSPQKKASYLKVWNGLDHPVLYRAAVLAFQDGALKPVAVKVCAAPAGGTNSQSWPAPIAAVAVAGFTAAPDDKTCK
ncbi:MAG TPA: hypothetical protein VJS38_15005 [Phenylobacterium sp.]|uniref:hypothetical protein n=1 Tax=Phenylobacterium sp. TaxID=1871053 RepID=UPI002B48984F|nr:hypothetical protein [Phenylobacterium sp.]HKR89479.1 hypothetical protein [Phenylobacterium sp.]